MKKLALVTIMALMINSSPALTTTPVPNHGSPKPTTGKIQTVIKKESGRHAINIPPKIKLLRSNPHRLTAIRFGHVNPVDAPDDEYLCSSGLRRPKIVTVTNWDPDADISDYAKSRLNIARALALAKHRQTWPI